MEEFIVNNQAAAVIIIGLLSVTMFLFIDIIIFLLQKLRDKK